ncbi:flavin reductase family protein [Ruegeria arenilitoris]|nr:flavin reductase family protein [Ruegeria arenilitoris]
MTTNAIELRNAFGTFMTGVTVVTTKEEDGTPRGFTANSFSSVSLDPPLLLICIANTAFSADVFRNASGFAVNILAEGQIETSNLFASKSPEKFEKASWTQGPAGNPVIDDVLSWFDCTVHDVFDAGDHFILVGKVEGFATNDGGPLGYARGGYVTMDLERKVAQRPNDNRIAVSTIVECDGKVFLTPGKEAGTLKLPRRVLEKGEATLPALEGILHAHGLNANVGFLYSVFDDESGKPQEVVYRTTTNDAVCSNGQFFDLESLDMSVLETDTLKRILDRFRVEHQNQIFGLYVGPAAGGNVHPVSG